MDVKEMWELVSDVVWYEAYDSESAHDYTAEGLTVDVERTVERVVDALLKNGTYDRVRHWEQWKYEETVHLAALDWFSSYEPVLIRLETANA